MQRDPIVPDAADRTDDEISPDVVPRDGARGAATIPDANDSGITTPPISGWGETLTGEEREVDEPRG